MKSGPGGGGCPPPPPPGDAELLSKTLALGLRACPEFTGQRDRPCACRGEALPARGRPTERKCNWRPTCIATDTRQNPHSSPGGHIRRHGHGPQKPRAPLMSCGRVLDPIRQPSGSPARRRGHGVVLPSGGLGHGRRRVARPHGTCDFSAPKMREVDGAASEAANFLAVDCQRQRWCRNMRPANPVGSGMRAWLTWAVHPSLQSPLRPQR